MRQYTEEDLAECEYRRGGATDGLIFFGRHDRRLNLRRPFVRSSFLRRHRMVWFASNPLMQIPKFIERHQIPVIFHYWSPRQAPKNRPKARERNSHHES